MEPRCIFSTSKFIWERSLPTKKKTSPPRLGEGILFCAGKRVSLFSGEKNAIWDVTERGGGAESASAFAPNPPHPTPHPHPPPEKREPNSRKGIQVKASYVSWSHFCFPISKYGCLRRGGGRAFVQNMYSRCTSLAPLLLANCSKNVSWALLKNAKQGLSIPVPFLANFEHNSCFRGVAPGAIGKEARFHIFHIFFPHTYVSIVGK